MYRAARILILDEPTAVLTPQEVEEFFQILRRMREQGKTVIIITHKLDEVLAISDEVTVMRDGRVVGRRKTERNQCGRTGAIDGRTGRPAARREETAPMPGACIAERARAFIDERSTRRMQDISFEVRAGEIVGIAGVEGNGQTELIEALAGLVRLRSELSGTIEFEGKDITPLLRASDERNWALRMFRKIGIDAGFLLDSSLCGELDSRRSLSPAGSGSSRRHHAR